MTVKELIEELQKQPQDVEVLTYTKEHGKLSIWEVNFEYGWVLSEDSVVIEGSPNEY